MHRWFHVRCYLVISFQSDSPASERVLTPQVLLSLLDGVVVGRGSPIVRVALEIGNALRFWRFGTVIFQRAALGCSDFVTIAEVVTTEERNEGHGMCKE